MIRRAYRLLASRATLLWLSGLWIAYYVTLSIWSREAFVQTIERLGGNPLVQLAAVGFIVSAACNIVRATWERAARGARALLVAWGALPLGGLVFLTGFVMSAMFREDARMIVIAGGEIQPAWRSKPYQVTSVDAALKDELLDVKGDAASGIFRFAPFATAETPAGPVRIGPFPPVRIEGAYYHVLQFGLAPGILLTEGDKTLADGYMALRLLPLGSEDWFEVPTLPYKFHIRIAPTREIEKEGTVGRIYNLKSPAYDVRIIKAGAVAFQGRTGAGAAVEFDGLRLAFTVPTHWTYIEAARDPGLPVIVAGLALISVGIVFRAIRVTIFAIKALASSYSHRL